MKIGVSETYLPGYGQMPVVTPEEGRIRIGINDKKLDDNVGLIKFVVVKVSASALAKFADFWKEARKTLR
jgi:DNA/RNA endonuclease YhcR with UshA esterase domain